MASDKRIGTINVGIQANVNKFKRDINSARGSLGRFADTARKFKAMIAPAAGAVAGFAYAMQQHAAVVDDLSKTATKLGTTTDELQALQHAAAKAGVEANTLNMALQRMTRRVAEAAIGTGEAKDAIRQLGMDAKKLNQLAPHDQIVVVADALNNVGSQSERIRLMFKLFDSEGVALAPMFTEGSKAIRETEAEMRKLGLLISQDLAKQTEAVNDKWADVGMTFRGLKNDLLPFFNFMSDGLADLIDYLMRAGRAAMWTADKLYTYTGAKAAVYYAGRAGQMVRGGAAKVGIGGPTTNIAGSLSGIAGRMAGGMSGAATTAKQFGSAIFGAIPNLRNAQSSIRNRLLMGAFGFGTGADMSNWAPKANPMSGMMGRIAGGFAGNMRARADRFMMEKGFQLRMMTSMMRMMGNAVLLGMRQPEVMRLNNASIGAVDARSREGFGQRVRAMRNDPQFRVMKDQLGELKKIAQNTAKGAGGEAAAAFA